MVSPCPSDEEMELMDEVELSSDEENEEDDEVALIILKRPPAVVRTVHDVEVSGRLAGYHCRCLDVIFCRLLSQVPGRGQARPPSLPRSRQATSRSTSSRRGSP